MSKYRNCMNCGAPLEIDSNKCPYCGTSYVDICGLKIDGHTPFALSFTVTDHTGKPKGIVTGLFVADQNLTMEQHTENVYAYGGKSNYCMMSWPAYQVVSANLNLTCIPRKDGTMLRYELYKD